MAEKKKIDLGITALDEMFMDDKTRQELSRPKIYEIPIELIDPFPDHPFQVRMDEDMEQLVESVRERGIITPVTLRPKDDGRYEIVSGHRRTKACELCGLPTVKAEIRDLRSRGVRVSPDNLSISSRASLLFPWHNKGQTRHRRPLRKASWLFPHHRCCSMLRQHI